MQLPADMSLVIAIQQPYFSLLCFYCRSHMYLSHCSSSVSRHSHYLFLTILIINSLVTCNVFLFRDWQVSQSLCLWHHQYVNQSYDLAVRLSAAELAAQQMTQTTIQTISSQAGGGSSGGYSYNIELDSAGGSGGGRSSSSSTTIRQTTSSTKMSSTSGGSSSSSQMMMGGGGVDGELMGRVLPAAAVEGGVSSSSQSIEVSSSKRSSSITDISTASSSTLAGD